jgi:hypothetical protein
MLPVGTGYPDRRRMAGWTWREREGSVGLAEPLSLPPNFQSRQLDARVEALICQLCEHTRCGGLELLSTSGGGAVVCLVSCSLGGCLPDGVNSQVRACCRRWVWRSCGDRLGEGARYGCRKAACRHPGCQPASGQCDTGNSSRLGRHRLPKRLSEPSTQPSLGSTLTSPWSRATKTPWASARTPTPLRY